MPVTLFYLLKVHENGGGTFLSPSFHQSQGGRNAPSPFNFGFTNENANDLRKLEEEFGDYMKSWQASAEALHLFIDMNKNILTKKSAEDLIQPQVTPKYDVIKLGIDWHANQFTVARIIDNGGPEPAQRFKPEKFLEWVDKQLSLGKKVYSCYEAGAGGYSLHRQLVEKGVVNYVVTPRNLDQDHKRVSTDKTESRQLVLDLDRYLRGNPKALRVVHVPTQEQEQRRQQSRQRKQMQQLRLSLATQGRMLMLGQGIKESNEWWRQNRWPWLAPQLAPWLVEALETFRRIILRVDEEEKALIKKVTERAKEERPKGMGALTSVELEDEVIDWNRFKNRKSVGSFTGLTGGVSSSDKYHLDLPISKAGHRRLRTILIELAWRWVRYQSQCPLVKRWAPALLNPKAHKRARKRAIVALARQLFVQLWRWRTGRLTLEELGWNMTGQTNAAQAAA